MQFPIRKPGKLTRYGVFLTITMVNMTACAVSAEDAMAASQLPPPEVITGSEQQTPSPEMQFLEIQKILGQIDRTPNNVPSNTHNPDVNLAIKSSTDSKGASKGMMMAGDASPNQSKLDMGKGEMMKGMSPGSPASKRAMGMGNMMQGMPPDAQPSNEVKGMSKGMMNKSMMGQRPMPQTTSMQASESLPGYPQAPHLYHLGEADFFLDHSQHLSLSSLQRESLTAIKNQWLAQQNDINAQISTIEEALWQATAQGQPDIVDIRIKIADSEALNGQLRLRFISLVGRAVNILTPEQVGLLISAEKLP